MKLRNLYCFLLIICAPLTLVAQSQVDIDALKKVLDRYLSTQINDQMLAQGELMANDRIWMDNVVGRRTDNLENMRLQQQWVDHRKKVLPGFSQQVEDRDKLIKFYADGKIAVVSFYRYATFLFPSGTSEEIKKEYAATAEWIMLVLEKRDDKWVIVATHV